MQEGTGIPDAVDLQILQALQDDIPLTARPFATLAARLGIAEPLLLTRLTRLHESGIIRGISPIIEARPLGLCAATLVALPAPPPRIHEIAALVSSFPEVSHNFRRDHPYSLWFTLAARNEAELDRILSRILETTGFCRDEILDLRTTRKIKIHVRFPLAGSRRRS
ncbi:MAG: Lrp/AsnC family transcriptional regulator [Methanomicrobiales archaeon]|nr:Lrp/AsnC family transcriptional regulator [Methanomicrobiales archaeon]